MKSNSTIIPRIILLIGLILFLVIFLNRNFVYTIFHLPKWSQFIYALVTALICFFASYISNRKDYQKNVRSQGMISLLPWLGMIAICAAIFLVSVDLEKSTERLVIYLNYSLSGIGFSYTYLVILTYLYPQIMNDEQTVPRDPLSELPKNLQKLINEGKDAIAIATVKIVAIGASTIVVSVFFLGSTKFPLAILGVEALTVMIIVIIARYFVAKRWQKQARQSGISEKKLKEAAKLAGLPWMNIKE